MTRRTNPILLLTTVAFMMILLTVKGLAQSGSERKPDLTIDAATRKSTIEGITKQLNDSYIFPEVAQKMESALRQRFQNKEYDEITSAKQFANKLTDDLQAVSHDKHLRVVYSHDLIPVRASRNEPTAEEQNNFRRFARRVNYGFEKVERLPGNVGYLDFRGFIDPELGGEALAAAMNFLSNTDALIIDMRQNGGGDPSMVALVCSYLFGSEPVHLNDLYWREGNRTDQFWTKATVPGKRYEGKDVYVLTSNRTFSAAEEFTYNLKNLKRATIVGETTGGGANPGGAFRINDHFEVFIPTGRAINPITKTNWEGVGVKPDVEVSKELALKTAHLLALNKIAAKITDERLKDEYKQLTEETQKELDALTKK